MQNILTFDIEEWFHANYEDEMHIPRAGESNFRKNMETILELCRKNSCKATFFVLGYIAENYPDIVRRIINEGHEVASHGCGHQLAYSQTYNEFKGDVERSIKILEDVTGEKVLGYRAPSWSIVNKNIHYLKALEELGLMYDASIFPVQNFLYGIPDAKRHIHKPVINGEELKIWEVPTSVFNIVGKGMGYSGGFYFRFFPKFFINYQIRKSEKQEKPAIVYLHPREIDLHEKKIVLPPKERFIHYYNVGGTYKKLDDITKKHSFTSIREIVGKL